MFGGMFGGFGGIIQGPRLGQLGPVISVTPIAGGPGGFPGVFPAMGPGQSGGAGLLELQARLEKCMKERNCPVTYGPPPQFL